MRENNPRDKLFNASLQQQNSRQGYSYIEMVVTLAVIVIVSGITVLSFASVERRMLQKEAAQLKINLGYAQKMALTSGTSYTVLFDVQNNQYLVGSSHDINRSNGESLSVYKLTGCSIESVNTRSSAVTYTSRGTTGDACTISLGSKHYFVNLTVNVGAGRVAVKPIVKKDDK